MVYKTTFDLVGASVPARQRTREDACPCRLSLGDVREIARVRLNGRDLGVRFMPPYEFEVPAGVLRASGNALEVEVTNLGANRLRWNDVSGVDWKYFCDINMIGTDYDKDLDNKLDASRWRRLRSGLLGPVALRAACP